MQHAQEMHAAHLLETLELLEVALAAITQQGPRLASARPTEGAHTGENPCGGSVSSRIHRGESSHEALGKQLGTISRGRARTAREGRREEVCYAGAGSRPRGAVVAPESRQRRFDEELAGDARDLRGVVANVHDLARQRGREEEGGGRKKNTQNPNKTELDGHPRAAPGPWH